MHENTLKDVTNSKRMVEELGFKKKLSFGDEKMMEEIKKRERKVLRDINQMRSAIVEIEKETERIRSVEMPQLVSDYGRIQDSIKVLSTDIGELDQQLDMKASECGNEKRDQVQISENMLIKYDIEVTKEVTRLDQQVSERRHEWDAQVFDMVQSKPDPDHVDQIRSLKQELKDCETQWHDMEQKNDEQCDAKKSELVAEFNQYKQDKELVLEELKSKEQELLLTLEQTKVKRDLSDQDSQLNQDKISELKKEIVDITSQINKLDKETIPLESELRVARSQYHVIKSDCDQVNQVCESLKKENNLVYERYLQEKRIKKRLQFAIEEMQGYVRNFAILTSRDKFVAESSSSLFCKLNNRRYQFSRILDMAQLERITLFGEEFETYFDTLLRKQQDFSFILCNPNKRPLQLADTIHEFLQESPLFMDMYHLQRQATKFNFQSKVDNSITTLHVIELTENIETELHKCQLLRSTIPCILHLLDPSSSSMFMYLDLSQRLMKEGTRTRMN